MPERHRHRVGRYLIVDDESGIVAYDDQILKRWDGALVRKNGWETRHPQEFVRAKRDPYPLKDVRPPQENLGCLSRNPSEFIGNTTVRAPHSLGFRLTTVGIGQMRIGCDFIVREGFETPAMEIWLVDDLGNSIVDDNDNTIGFDEA